ncbi:C40 family peptidase [Amycolatopsis magusensis]|uniref:C40 family peptidase n=1 Tax=Amycolatopsis magusensis TaxID=882444 RepID=UPI00379F533E
MSTASWPASGRKHRIGTVTAAFAVGAGAFLALPGTASATPAPVTASVPAPPEFSGTSHTEAAKPAGQSLVELAAEQQGKPYSYGATGPDSFDCSGLTQFVHRQLGIELPRTSRDQRAAVTTVDRAAMQPGDLIFFANSGGSVYHVGIFAGDGQMWAAPESGDVVRLQQIWTDSYTVGRAW